jgi:hypothetical protein
LRSTLRRSLLFLFLRIAPEALFSLKFGKGVAATFKSYDARRSTQTVLEFGPKSFS